MPSHEDIIDQFTLRELYGIYRLTEDKHKWADCSFSYLFGENLAVNSEPGEETDYEALGDLATFRLLEARVAL